MAWRKTAAGAAVVGAAMVALTGTAHADEWKHVKSTTQDVHVYKSSSGSDIWGHLNSCQAFWVDMATNGRYHTTVTLASGQTVDGWVSTNPDWIASGTC